VSSMLDLMESDGIGRGSRWFDRWAYDALNAIEMSHGILAALGAYEKV
jgi:hypothetical protein